MLTGVSEFALTIPSSRSDDGREKHEEGRFPERKHNSVFKARGHEINKDTPGERPGYDPGMIDGALLINISGGESGDLEMALVDHGEFAWVFLES